MEIDLVEASRRAKAMGTSYGIWESIEHQKKQEHTAPLSPRKKKRPSKRRYTDEQAFTLWQAGKNDCEIGKVLGVSRQIIQRWRDTMELPSTINGDIDTENYHLVNTPNGVFVVYGEEE